MSFGERLKRLRKKRKITQKDLANVLGVDNTTISKWESDIYEPEMTAINKIADYFNVTVDYLLGRTDDLDENIKNTNIMSKFPMRLRKLRKEKKLTAKKLGEKLDLAESTISGYENGNRSPDINTLQKIADFLETSVDYLLGRTDEPHPLGYDPDKVDALFLSRRGKKGERADYLEDLSEADRKLIESLLRKAADIVAKEEKEKEEDNNNE